LRKNTWAESTPINFWKTPKPAIYYLNNNGVLWIRFNKGFELGVEDLEFKYVKKFYEDKHASEIFINHCVFISDLYIQVKELEKNKKKSGVFIFDKNGALDRIPNLW